MGNTFRTASGEWVSDIGDQLERFSAAALWLIVANEVSGRRSICAVETGSAR